MPAALVSLHTGVELVIVFAIAAIVVYALDRWDLP